VTTLRRYRHYQEGWLEARRLAGGTLVASEDDRWIEILETLWRKLSPEERSALESESPTERSEVK
jgi:hypothetical protein